MAFTAAQVMNRASIILQDGDAVRWTAPELRDWLNEAQRAVVLAMPTALTATVTLALTAGTKQTLPAQYAALSRVIRNAGANGKAIRTIAKREILDAQIPGWHSTADLPFAASAVYVFQDPITPREFYVIPGSTGTSHSVEAVVAKNPSDVPLPSGSANLNVDSYTTTSEFPDLYQGVLLDFMLFRAFSKDSAAPDAANRAQAHLQLAQQTLASMGASTAAISLATQYIRG